MSNVGWNNATPIAKAIEQYEVLANQRGRLIAQRGIEFAAKSSIVERFSEYPMSGFVPSGLLALSSSRSPSRRANGTH
jgi:hypothetical protein